MSATTQDTTSKFQEESVSVTLTLSARTAALLEEAAQGNEQEASELANTILAEGLEDLSETMAGLRRGVEAAKAGDVVDLEDFILQRKLTRSGAR
jgi:predicted transcriptional regulator